MNDARMQKFAALLVGLTVLARVDATTAADISPENVVERFEFSSDDQGVFVPVSVGGETKLFLVDTGCTYSVFDLSLLKSDPVGSHWVRTPTGEVAVPEFDSPPASLGRIDLRQRGSGVEGFDFSQLRSVRGVEFYGIVGMDFLGRHVVRIDPDRKECLILRYAADDMGERLDLRFGHGGLAETLVRVGGMPSEWFLIDTGYSGGGALKEPLVDDLIATMRAEEVSHGLFMDLSGNGRNSLIRAESATIGAFKIKRPVFSAGRQNTVGMRLLSRFVVTFDFPNKCMYLRPSKRLDTPDAWDRSGLHIIRRDGTTVIHSVDKDSVAEAAGLREGQELVKVGHLDAKDGKLARLRELLCSEGTTVPVVAKRDGEQFEVSLDLK